METRLRDSKNFIPFPVVGHALLPRGGMCFNIHDSTDVDLPACLIPLSGDQGISWGDVETGAIAKTSLWYHVPIARAQPFSVVGDYDESFVQLNEDLSRITADVTDKVFVAVDKIQHDYETVKAHELDTR
jgi:hypothetical protein